MVIYILLTVFVVGLGFLLQQETSGQITLTSNTLTKEKANNYIILGAIFLLLVFVSASRIAVGGDYWGYTLNFEKIEAGRAVSTEIGFNFIVKLMHYLFGLDNYLVIFGLFAVVTIFFMVRAISNQSDWMMFSFFLLMTGGYYFSTMTSVRYYFALAVGLFAAKYAIRREWGKLIIILMATALIHMSVLILFPIYWLATRKYHRIHLIGLGTICISFLFFQDFYRRIIFLFYPYYEGSMFDTGDTSIVNIAKGLAILIFSLIYYRKIIQKNEALQFYFYLNLFALILYVFCSFVPEISRIGYYMNVTNIFLIPGILKKIENKKWRMFFTWSVVGAYILYFAFFLHSCYDIDVRLLPYLTWIYD